MAKVSLRIYNQEIEAMIDRGQLDEAIAHCRHILKTFPKHLETYRLLGKAYLEYKRYPDAEDIFSRVLAAVPDDFVANVGLSIIRDEQNRLDEAIWHMERAFETQTSNVAIEGELKRLHGRREGAQPPRIRMTRGALAQMYMRGNLLPQAISEIKSILGEDPGRMDMQVLLARAYYNSGGPLKNDAAEVASTILRTNPYCFDANRVLVEILSVDRPESVQPYRQRVVELDPYAAQVTSSVFLVDEVPNMAVTLEKLDWNGQPVGMQSDWEATQAISLEGSQRPGEQPDWLRGTLSESAPSQPPAAVPTFDAAPPLAPAEPANEIPDFMRAAGWGESTGAFDESKSIFADDEPAATGAQPIEQGDLPDWVKAMAPPPPAATPAQEEELPDWINKIGTSALPVSAAASDQPDWMKDLDQPAEQPAAESEPDWLKQLSESEAPASAAAAEQPDWLKSFSGPEETAPAAGAPADDLSWLGQLGEPSESKTAETWNDESDFFKKMGDQPEPVAAAPSTDEFDFLNELPGGMDPLAPSQSPEPQGTESLGKSSEEQDDAFAWLENLAAKQGATEGLLTKPEERLQEEPDWVKQAKDVQAQPVVEVPVQQPPAQQPPVAQPAASVEELGKTSSEQDDAFAWLENLAAKQGASEGLLTKPEERLQEEPEWVKQAKSTDTAQPVVEAPVQQPPAQQPPVAQPTASVEELGKTSGEQDDAFAWLENLAAKQGASEGLLTKPEERLQEEPEWVKQAKDVQAQQPRVETPAPEQPAAMNETAAWLQSLDQEEATPATSSIEDTSAWLRGLDQEEPEKPTAEVSPVEDTAAWLRSLDDEPAAVAPQPAETAPADDLPAWMQSIEEQEVPVAKSAQEPEWTAPAQEEQPVPQEPAKVQTGGLPSWLNDLDQEEIQKPAEGDLPAWLRDETGEVVAEPTRIEPTRTSDWHPVETRQSEPEPEPLAPEPVAPPPPPVSVAQPPREKPKKAAPPSKPVYKEPVTRRAPEVPSSLDPVLVQARNELSRSNIPGALDNYGRLIRKGRFLEDVIYDLREALYRYPVEVSIWQSLGDAYMRANRLQDALDSYTKAEELLR